MLCISPLQTDNESRSVIMIHSDIQIIIHITHITRSSHIKVYSILVIISKWFLLSKPCTIMRSRIVNVRTKRNNSIWIDRRMTAIVVALDVIHVDST